MRTVRLGWLAAFGLSGGCLADPSPAADVETVTTTSGAASSTGTGASSSSTGAESTGGLEVSSGPGPGSDCVGLDEASCSEHEDCQAISGTPVDVLGETPCFRSSSFLECAPLGWCYTIITYACDPAGGPSHRFGSSCAPEGWVECWPDVTPTLRCDEVPLPEHGS
ncbi:MAG: hypothetical protein AAGA54_27665 [Myxococcota bacterium]